MLPSTAFYFYLYGPADDWYLLTSWKWINAGGGCFRNKCKGLIGVCATTGTKLAQFAFCSGPCLLPWNVLFSVFQFQDWDGHVKWTVNGKLHCFCNVIVMFDKGIPQLSTLLLTDSNHGLFMCLKRKNFKILLTSKAYWKKKSGFIPSSKPFLPVFFGFNAVLNKTLHEFQVAYLHTILFFLFAYYFNLQIIVYQISWYLVFFFFRVFKYVTVVAKPFHFENLYY